MTLEQISEGSCDTEDWSNNVENSVFAITRINYILKHIKQKKLFKIVILSLFLLYDLWSNTFFKYVNKKKLWKILLTPHFWTTVHDTFVDHFFC